MTNRSTLLLTTISILGCVQIKKAALSDTHMESIFTSPAGYSINRSTGKITFNFEPNKQSTFDIDTVNLKSVTLVGTFSQWKIDPIKYALSQKQNSWTLTLPIQAIRVPGSSGYPEFKFVINQSLWIEPASTISDGYVYSDSSPRGRNAVIIESEMDIQKVREQYEKLRTVLQKSSSNQLSVGDLANWRNVGGNFKKEFLFRSSAPWSPNEERRASRVRSFMKATDIKTIIGLAGDNTAEALRAAHEESDLAFLKNPGSTFFTNSTFNQVYYRSDSAEFADKLLATIEFINTATPPILIFCQEGKDRTGIFVATLRALLNDSWQAILSDYLESENAGFSSLPHENLLNYSFDAMIGPGRENLRDRIETFLANQTGKTQESVRNTILLFEKLASRTKEQPN